MFGSEVDILSGSGQISIYSTGKGRGDVNNSESIDISDLNYLTAFMFQGSPEPVPYRNGDTNCDGLTDVSDLHMSSKLYVFTPMYQ